eukprot:scaffold313633_cov31-Tisochrysis_lutea.AAC.6
MSTCVTKPGHQHLETEVLFFHAAHAHAVPAANSQMAVMVERAKGSESAHAQPLPARTAPPSRYDYT